MAAANAKVGVQTAAYFPDISISAQGIRGFGAAPAHRGPEPLLVDRLQSERDPPRLGPAPAQLRESHAQYDASVAEYRQTVLGALQQVEDNLASLRILEEEAQIQDAAVGEATQATEIANNEYAAGTVDYTTVVTTQVAELNDQESALAIRQTRLIASVALIEALGGDWQAADLPSSGQVTARRSQDPAAVAAPH